MKTYIINVSTNEPRRNHIQNVVSQNTCLRDNSFMHDGDLETISKEILAKYFGGKLNSLKPAVSCAYKHMLAYSELLKLNRSEYALILEDDIYLNDNFCEKLKNILNEIKQRKIENFIISLEESNLKYVKGSERKKNVLLYKKSKGRMTGAYLIDEKASKTMLSEIEQNKCNLPIDRFQEYCSDKGLLDIYWVHPTISIQGSLNGKMKSLIAHKSYGILKVMYFRIKRVYKKLLYRFS